MVYIYGGAFCIGEATRQLYGPDYFMAKDVVLVTINYRVDCFGECSIFLSLSTAVIAMNVWNGFLSVITES